MDLLEITARAICKARMPPNMKQAPERTQQFFIDASWREWVEAGREVLLAHELHAAGAHARVSAPQPPAASNGVPAR